MVATKGSPVIDWSYDMMYYWRIKIEVPGDKTREVIAQEYDTSAYPDPTKGITIVAAVKYIDGIPYAVEKEEALKFKASPRTMYYVEEWKSDIITEKQYQDRVEAFRLKIHG